MDNVPAIGAPVGDRLAVDVPVVGAPAGVALLPMMSLLSLTIIPSFLSLFCHPLPQYRGDKMAVLRKKFS
jgi:hypothetical protein